MTNGSIYAIIQNMNSKNKKLIVANWKMNVVSEKDAENLFLSIKNVVPKLDYVKMVTCPPHMYVSQVAALVDHPNYRVGGQDAYPEESGSRTGETSVLMMKNAGAEYIILGHSERRHLETKLDVARKISAVLEHEMTPIICIGEESRDKTWKKQLQKQLQDVFTRVPKKNPENIIIAYEPIWAISSDKKSPASAAECMEALEVIKAELLKIFKTAKAVSAIRFLYGGSLDDKNIEEFLKETDVDGFLIGRVSLDPRILMTMFRLVDDHVYQSSLKKEEE